MSRPTERILLLAAAAYVIANVVLYKIYRSPKERKAFHAAASAADNIILIAAAMWIAYRKSPYLAVLVPAVMLFVVYPVTYALYEGWLNGTDKENPWNLDKEWLDDPRGAYLAFIANCELFPFCYLLKSWLGLLSGRKSSSAEEE